MREYFAIKAILTTHYGLRYFFFFNENIPQFVIKLNLRNSLEFSHWIGFIPHTRHSFHMHTSYWIENNIQRLRNRIWMLNVKNHAQMYIIYDFVQLLLKVRIDDGHNWIFTIISPCKKNTLFNIIIILWSSTFGVRCSRATEYFTCDTNDFRPLAK